MTRWRSLWLGLIPLGLLIAAMANMGDEGSGQGAVQQRAFAPAHHFRTVVLILDSAGKSEMFDPALMPFVSSLQASSLSGGCRSCASKATFPCIKSIFEGREATMGTTLQDFSAFASSRTTWPTSLAALGMRLVVASDHTLNRLYPHAFVDSINYENLHVPLLERDAFVYRKANQWLDDPTIDVLILHIIGTDKVSHEYPVRGPVYVAKYREVDDFIRQIARRLQPQDYLYAISDHGHNELGGHTENASYVAQGPLFPPGVHQDLNAQDMLFLLSTPYGLTLPSRYEGQIRTDLMLLPPGMRENLLVEQARFWRLPLVGLTMDAVESRLNQHIARDAREGQRELAVDTLWRASPFWLAAALFLIAELPLKARRVQKRLTLHLEIALVAIGLALALMGTAIGAWLLPVAFFVRCLAKFGVARVATFVAILAALSISAFWIFPGQLTWIHAAEHRPLGFAAFYLVALIGGLLFAWNRRVGSWRAGAANVLWIIALAVWLLGYFGPLGYSLTRQGSLVVLVFIVPAVIILNTGVRGFFSIPALLLIGLLPIIHFDVESFNLKYLLLDRIPELNAIVRAAIAVMAAVLFVIALKSPNDTDTRMKHRGRKLMSLLLVVGWIAVSATVFQFEISKLIGTLLASLWFIGTLELFSRARLPLRWFALVSVIFLFLLLTFLLNGFALSHVDFRFATHAIIPFQKEAWRAPQLIAWAMAKYAFALVPAFAVLRLSTVGKSVWPQLLLLGWWRQLMIIAGALGLALFNARGMRDLCSEEIYFWTFLNITLWIAGMVVNSPFRRREVRDPALPPMAMPSAV